MIEFLLLHNRSRRDKKPNITKDAAAATLSFQRRTHAFKERFMTQHRPTPLATVTDYWDRTEAQTRQALHSHIPFWAKRRKLNDGTSQKQEKSESVEHRLYTEYEMARVHGELIRPMLDEEWTRGEVLWSFLLRSIQTHLYIHTCSLAYCLKNRSRCRFFFPLGEARTPGIQRRQGAHRFTTSTSTGRPMDRPAQHRSCCIQSRYHQYHAI